MRWASACFVLVLIGAMGCDHSSQGREYYYRNYGDYWVKYIPPYDSLEHFRISPDGRQVCYLIKTRGRWRVGINGRHWDDFQGIYPNQIQGEPQVVLSADGRHVGMVYQRETGRGLAGPEGPSSRPQWFVEIDRRVLGGFDGEFMPKIEFSRDGSAFGLTYRQRGQYYVQIFDNTFGPYERADFTITQEGDIYVAYLQGSYLHVKRVGRIGP